MDNKFTLRPVRSQRGAVLLLTMFLLALLSVLVIGFLSSMLTERKAARAYEETQRAKLLAQGAVSHAIDILRTNIPDPARLAESAATAPGENWVTNPGRLTIIRQGQPVVHVPLHTGEVSSAPPAGQPRDLESYDLNKPLPGQTGAAIAPGDGGSAPVMRVKWVNILKNPASPAEVNNQISGRYAFWIDDESSKLNFNTAVGKRTGAEGQRMQGHLDAGLMTPQFYLADSSTTTGGDRMYALGKPQSVNLDILLDDPAQLNYKKLVGHVFRHGFARHPEAVQDFVTVADPKAWYEKNKFNLTFYNRSPEFNAFGISRLFTTYIPLSLEAGPAYQNPFIYDPSGQYNAGSSEITHLNGLYGTFGFTEGTEDESGDTVNSGNRVISAQLKMLTDYLGRKWPGYSKSFVDKYGWEEASQIALNILLMARISTCQISQKNLLTFTEEFATRSTSVNYSPGSSERSGSTPERFYWNLTNPGTGKTTLMLPQMGGPQATEIRLFVRPVVGPAGGTKRNIEYYYETEYYAPPLSPVVDLSVFLTKMDYFRIEAAAGTKTVTQTFGVTGPGDTTGHKNWNNGDNLGLLQAIASEGTLLGPKNATHNGAAVPNRRIVRSATFRLTNVNNPNRVCILSGGSWTPGPASFDSIEDQTARVEIHLRAGLGVSVMPARPYQMIPLGETPQETLKAVFNVDFRTPGVEQVVSWQISDPRLSHDVNQWEISGPGAPEEVGTPGGENLKADGSPLEPAEESSEKSKFRYIQRGHDNSKIKGYTLNRTDEYTTYGRVSSPGYWSVLHTGMQSGHAWRTLDLGAESTQDSPPDWLLLDLFGATYPMAHDQWRIESTLPDEFSTASFMNSTAGQVNLNSRIYPRNNWFNPPARTKPLEAVFSQLRSDSEVRQLVEKIGDYQTDSQVFDYIGEVANVSGFAGGGTTQWQRESLLRNMAGTLTTKSNTFGVWGVSQSVRKARRNQAFGVFEKGDRVLAEKRFYALIERYVWTGRDGVPGNAHVSSAGKWDRLARQTTTLSGDGSNTDTLFQLPGSPPLKKNGSDARLLLDVDGAYPEFDGPERVGANPFFKASLGDVNYRPSSLSDAYNPPQAVIKYRVLYFQYLDQ